MKKLWFFLCRTDISKIWYFKVKKKLPNYRLNIQITFVYIKYCLNYLLMKDLKRNIELFYKYFNYIEKCPMWLTFWKE